jgi:transcription initiation factor TFIIH subunit 2
MADDGEQGYTWETEYERTWEVLKEDASGSLQASVDDVVHKAKRRRLLDRPLNIRLGMMRHLYIVLDISQAMEAQDLKPNRLMSTLKLLEKFIEEYFDQNPISQLGIITMHDKRAEKLSEMSGNFKKHVACLSQLKDKGCEGEASLQNALELASQSLRHMPSHASREVLIIFGSLSTCDPGDIFDTIKMLKEHSIRCSVIGLAASVHICQKLSTVTQGKYNVILDESHFREVLHQQTTPPAATASAEASLIRMGFPNHETRALSDDKASMCMCHLDSKSVSEGFGRDGYFCPQCHSKYCELPVDCLTCGLTLVSAPHLSRSYHHLFPLEPFDELPVDDVIFLKRDRFCYGCQKHVPDTMVYQCVQCKHVFCVDCDLFVHETLHSCPGCASSRHLTSSMAATDIVVAQPTNSAVTL